MQLNTIANINTVPVYKPTIFQFSPIFHAVRSRFDSTNGKVSSADIPTLFTIHLPQEPGYFFIQNVCFQFSVDQNGEGADEGEDPGGHDEHRADHLQGNYVVRNKLCESFCFCTVRGLTK